MDVEVDADGNRHVIAGVPDKFTVHAKDAFGNRLDTGGLAVTGTATGTDNVPVKVIDNGNGSYTIDYTCLKTGPYQVELAANGHKLGGVHNPLKVICSPNVADPSNSIAFGPGVEGARIGAENKFTVQARDAYGNNIKKGGARVAGAIVAPDGSSAPVVAKDNGDGTYNCSYPGVTKNGHSLLTPTLEGHPVKDAPFKINVDSDDTDPSKTKVKLVPLGMEVELCDRHGNKREPSKKDNVQCKTKKLSEDEAKAHRNEDGTFSIKWPASFHGDYEAKVLVNGHNAPGGPWVAKVAQPPLSAEHAAAVTAAYPKVAKVLHRLLLSASPDDRNRIVAAFQGGDHDDGSSSDSD